MTIDGGTLAGRVVRLAHETGDGQLFRQECLRLLADRVGVDMAVFNRPDRPVEDKHCLHGDLDAVNYGRELFLDNPVAHRPLFERLATGSAFSDVDIGKGLHDEMPHQHLCMGPQLGARYAAYAGLRAPGRGLVALMLVRTSPFAFRAREIDSLTAALPTLALADAALQGVRDGAPAAAPLEELRPRQREICLYVARGFTNAQIGQLCGLSAYTVRNHLAALFKRFHVSNRAELISMLMPDGTQPRV